MSRRISSSAAAITSDDEIKRKRNCELSQISLPLIIACTVATNNVDKINKSYNFTGLNKLSVEKIFLQSGQYAESFLDDALKTRIDNYVVSRRNFLFLSRGHRVFRFHCRQQTSKDGSYMKARPRGPS